MIRHINNFITRFSSKKHLLLVAMLLLLLIVIVLPAAEKDLDSITGSSHYLEGYFFVNPSELLPYITSLNNEAITFYMFYLLTIDMIFPLIYSIFLCLVLERMRKTILPALSVRRTLLPLLLLCINLLENTLLIYILWSSQLDFTYWIAILWMLNLMKWLLILVVGFDVLRGLLILLFGHLKRFRQDQLMP